jgi:hypothetical protein
MPHGSDIITFHHYYENRKETKYDRTKPENGMKEKVEELATGKCEVEVGKESNRGEASGTGECWSVECGNWERENEEYRRDQLGPGY